MSSSINLVREIRCSWKPGTAIGVWQIYERRVVKVFVHTDPFNKFVSCLVYLPRESFNTNTRDKIEEKIGLELGAVESELTTHFIPDSVLVRIRLVYKIENKKYLEVDAETLQAVVEKITRSWSDVFSEQSISAFGAADGAVLSRRFQNAFPSAYQEIYGPDHAHQHISLFDRLDGSDDLAIDFYQDQQELEQHLRVTLFHRNEPLELSDMVPMLENLGFRVVMEHPYSIAPERF